MTALDRIRTSACRRLLEALRERGNLTEFPSVDAVAGRLDAAAMDELFPEWRFRKSARFDAVLSAHLFEPLAILGNRCGLYWTIDDGGLRVVAWRDRAGPLLKPATFRGLEASA